MIRQFDYRSISESEILCRDIQAEQDVQAAVDDIIANVREKGDAALREYSLKFDKAELKDIEVPASVIEAAYDNADLDFIETLELAAKNIREFHKHQVRNGFVMADQPGKMMGQKITPLARVGIYIPGGTASYPSTVLMNAIPAKLAGVEEIIMVSPPGRDGKIPGDILAAAKVAGVTRIFQVGGAQAIAALAYGTQTIPAVDKIVGPGNIFVATAKRRVYGRVDIDMIAGPSEILVLADKNSNPVWVAADLLSQAEHDRLATAVLVTDSKKLAEEVSAELERQIPLLPRADIARESIETNGKIVLVEDLTLAVEAANRIAPEHLELCVDDPFALLPMVRNAGSIFLGRYAPEALGDYLGGPNHTLPTSGTARFSSPLSVDDFVKKSSFIYYTADALSEVRDQIAVFARHEGLEAHARSALLRGAAKDSDVLK